MPVNQLASTLLTNSTRCRVWHLPLSLHTTQILPHYYWYTSFQISTSVCTTINPLGLRRGAAQLHSVRRVPSAHQQHAAADCTEPDAGGQQPPVARAVHGPEKPPQMTCLSFALERFLLEETQAHDVLARAHGPSTGMADAEKDEKVTAKTFVELGISEQLAEKRTIKCR